MVHCTSDGLVDGGLGSIPRLGVDPEVQCTLQKIYFEIGNRSEVQCTLYFKLSTHSTA